MGVDQVDFYLYDQVKVDMSDYQIEGRILDIGGGGEGVVGRHKGGDVVAIDIRKAELEEAAEGPLKIVMDAREMQFLESTFDTATAFFSMMYLKTREDQQKVLEEAWRVLKPGGKLHLWEIDLAEKPAAEQESYVVFLRYTAGGETFGTGYGQKWPVESRGPADYQRLAEAAGFQAGELQRNEHTFYQVFLKV